MTNAERTKKVLEEMKTSTGKLKTTAANLLYYQSGWTLEEVAKTISKPRYWIIIVTGAGSKEWKRP